MKVAVVGLGWWGPKLVRNFLNNHGVASVVGCDTDAARLDVIAREHGIATAASVDEVLADPGVVAVALATPPQTHGALARAALERGKHVLVEKPPARDVAEVEDLIALAASKRLVYMVDSTYIYSDAIQRLGDLTRGGFFEPITSIECLRYGDNVRRDGVQRLERAMLANGVDAIDDLIFHDLAVLRFLLGSAEVEVLSVTTAENLWPGLCDTAHVHLRIGRTAVHVGVSWTLPERRRDITMFDRTKFLVYNDLTPYDKLRVYPLDGGREEIVPLSSANWEPLQALVSHFIDCIRTGRAPITGGAFMLDVMRMFSAVRAGHARAAAVSAPPLAIA